MNLKTDWKSIEDSFARTEKIDPAEGRSGAPNLDTRLIAIPERGLLFNTDVTLRVLLKRLRDELGDCLKSEMGTVRPHETLVVD